MSYVQSSSALAEQGSSTGMLQEKFLMYFDFPEFEIMETYQATNNVEVFKRKLGIAARRSDICYIGQQIDLPSAWVLCIRGNAAHLSVGLRLMRLLSQNGEVDTEYFEEYVFCKFKITMVDKDKDVLYTKQWKSWDQARKIYVHDDYSMPDFMNLEDLADNEPLYMPGKTLRFICEGVLYGGFRHTPIVRVDGPQKFAISRTLPIPQLSSTDLWGNTEFCDIHLVSHDEITQPAHKLILQKASLMWKNLLSTAVDQDHKHKDDGNGNAKKVSTLHLEVSGARLAQLLQFIYTGEVDQAWENVDEVCELISVADNFEMCGLRRLCFQRVLDTLTTTTFLKIAIAFRKHNAPQKIADALQKYFLRNQDKITQHADFKTFAKENKETFLNLILYSAKY